MATPKSLRRNPGWKLEPATIDIVAAARTATGKTAAQVIHAWAMAWQEGVKAERDGEKKSEPAFGMAVIPADKPLAVRVETPYQIERRERLEKLRAQLAEGSAGGAEGQNAAAQTVSAEPIVVPFDVVVNGEKHRVIEYHGRRILEWIGPTSTVMKKNLTPQEVVIYWRERIQ
jgi:hypothetical protein